MKLRPVLVFSMILLAGCTDNVTLKGLIGPTGFKWGDKTHNKTIRITFMENWQGSLKNTTDAEWTGYLALLLRNLQAEMGFQVLETRVRSTDTQSRFTNCIWDIVRNSTDMCLGTFWRTPFRSRLVDYSSPFEQAQFRLLVKHVSWGSGSWMTQMFHPFHDNYWFLLVIISLLISVALWLAETDFSARDREQPPQRLVAFAFASFLNSVYWNFLGFCNQGTVYEPRTRAGKIFSLGYSFFILISTAAYVANLAAFLTQATDKPRFEFIEEVIQQGHVVCIQETIRHGLSKQYPLLRTISFGSDDEAVERLVASVGGADDECQAAVVELNLFKGKQRKIELCELSLVGPALLSIPIGLVLPFGGGWTYQINNLIDTYRSDGDLEKWIADNRVSPVCPVNEKDEDTSRIGVMNMAGVIVITGAFYLVGCTCLVVKKSRLLPRLVRWGENGNVAEQKSAGCLQEAEDHGTESVARQLNKQSEDIQTALSQQKTDIELAINCNIADVHTAVSQQNQAILELCEKQNEEIRCLRKDMANMCVRDSSI